MYPIKSKSFKLHQKGESTILFLVTIFSILLIIYLSTQLIKKEIGYQIRLIKKHECLIESIDAHINFIDQMDKANELIITSNLLSFIPTLKVTTKSIIKLMKIAQEFSYTFYLFKLSIIKDCRLEELKNFLGPTPYSRKSRKFKRNQIGAAIKKVKTYSLNMCFNILKIEAKTQFQEKYFKLAKNVSAKKVFTCN